MLNSIIKDFALWIYSLFVELLGYAAKSLLGLMNTDLAYFESSVPVVTELIGIPEDVEITFPDKTFFTELSNSWLLIIIVGVLIGIQVLNGASIKKIIEAFLRGGWKAAALETAKRYWPYILCAAIAIIMLPVLIVASMPSVLGIGNPSDSGVTEEDISEMYISGMDEILCMPEVSAASGIKAVGQPLSYRQLYSVCLVLTGSNTEIITREYFRLARVEPVTGLALASLRSA